MEAFSDEMEENPSNSHVTIPRIVLTPSQQQLFSEAPESSPNPSHAPSEPVSDASNFGTGSSSRIVEPVSENHLQPPSPQPPSPQPSSKPTRHRRKSNPDARPKRRNVAPPESFQYDNKWVAEHRPEWLEGERLLQYLLEFDQSDIGTARDRSRVSKAFQRAIEDRAFDKGTTRNQERIDFRRDRQAFRAARYQAKKAELRRNMQPVASGPQPVVLERFDGSRSWSISDGSVKWPVPGHNSSVDAAVQSPASKAAVASVRGAPPGYPPAATSGYPRPGELFKNRPEVYWEQSDGTMLTTEQALAVHLSAWNLGHRE